MSSGSNQHWQSILMDSLAMAEELGYLCVHHSGLSLGFPDTQHLVRCCCTLFVPVTVVTNDTQSLTFEGTHTVSVLQLPPVAVLSSPPKSGASEDLVLDASQSTDPNRDPDGLVYSYSCRDVSPVTGGRHDMEMLSPLLAVCEALESTALTKGH